MPVTDFIESTQTLLEKTETELKKITGMNVYIFPGTGHEQLFDFLPGCAMPAAVIIYQGSNYGNRPRRTAKIDVLLIAYNGEATTGASSVRGYLDSAMAKLDEYIYNQAKWEIQKDDMVDMGPNLEAILATFQVEDH